MVRRELRISIIHLYKTFISRINTNEGWYNDIKCNIEVKQVYPLSPTIFGIDIDKLEECLETTGCKTSKISHIIIIPLLYASDITILVKFHDDLSKKFKNLHVYCSKMGMTVNNDKTNVMIIKSKNIIIV